MRLLAIEGDAVRARAITTMMTGAGWSVETAAGGAAGLELARAYAYDAILLDLILPDIPGREVLRRLRREGIETPLLALTATADPMAVVDALQLGADDCLPAAYAPAELAARLAAAVRRSRGFCRPVIEVGPLTINLNARTAAAGGRLLPLTAKEYEVLELMALRKGAVVSRDVILDQLYGGMDEPDTRAVDVHVCRLRRKIAEACGADGLIQTSWGRGFMLCEARPQALAA